MSDRSEMLRKSICNMVLNKVADSFTLLTPVHLLRS